MQITSSGAIFSSDPSRVGGERVFKTSFKRPDVGSCFGFARVPEEFLGGRVDILEVVDVARD